MLEVDVPGHGLLRLDHLVLDFNGTLAQDGVLRPGVAQRLLRLSASLAIHVVTGDTFGSTERELAGLPCALVKLQRGSGLVPRLPRGEPWRSDAGSKRRSSPI